MHKRLIISLLTVMVASVALAADTSRPAIIPQPVKLERKEGFFPEGVHAGVYCAGKEEPFEFLQDVLAEVIELFPDQYIHVGGDEVPKDNWKKCERCQARIMEEGPKNEHGLQSYFIRRIEKIVNAKGRNLIGWSEIREGGLAQNAAVMDWIGGATEAASEGHDGVMLPTAYCYLDYYQSQNKSSEPKASGGVRLDSFLRRLETPC